MDNFREQMLMDYGPKPYVLDVNKAAIENPFFRTAVWTGNHMQMTLMSIPVGEEIGWEIHTDTDQMLRIEQGSAVIFVREEEQQRILQRRMGEGEAVFIPQGTWHNMKNEGNIPLKLSSIYAPPHHKHGTVHRTKADA